MKGLESGHSGCVAGKEGGPEICTVFKCSITNPIDGRRQGQAGKSSAAGKAVGVHKSDPFRHGEAGESGAARKGRIANPSEAGWQGQAGESGAAGE